MSSYYRFKARRHYRKLSRLSKNIWFHTTRLARGYLFNRTKRLRHVQRFIIVIIAIFGLSIVALWGQINELKSYYLVDGGRSGGTYIEGSIGAITRINPLFPDEPNAETATRLIFNGLLRYNGQGVLEGDLAETWQPNDDGSIYTARLRENIFWHDGQPMNADDVVFTVQTIQNPGTRSAYINNWRGIEVTKLDQRTIQFKLPSSYSAFANSLTLPIVPKHILGGITPGQLRLADFNQHPVGTGPFVFEQFMPTQNALRLRAYTNYVHGSPKLKRFIIRTYTDADELREAFAQRQITATSGFGVFEFEKYQSINHGELYEWPIANQSFVFMNTATKLNDAKVRRALTQATQLQAVASKLNFRFHGADSPLLPEHLGYNEELTQLKYNEAEANKGLDEAGWLMGSDGFRAKDGARLQLQLVTQNSDIYPELADTLQQQWRKVGVDLQVKLLNNTDLTLQYIKPRKYDVLLLGVSLGADPDVYSYWHSSQANDPGLNFSKYDSKQTDVSLESARSRLDTSLRVAKYETFLRAWRDDAPAIAAYRPSFYYGAQERVKGLDVTRLITPSDRFYNVQNWTVNTQPVLKRIVE